MRQCPAITRETPSSVRLDGSLNLQAVCCPRRAEQLGFGSTKHNPAGGDSAAQAFGFVELGRQIPGEVSKRHLMVVPVLCILTHSIPNRPPGGFHHLGERFRVAKRPTARRTAVKSTFPEIAMGAVPLS